MKLRQCGNEVGETMVKCTHVWRMLLTQWWHMKLYCVPCSQKVMLLKCEQHCTYSFLYAILAKVNELYFFFIDLN